VAVEIESRIAKLEWSSKEHAQDIREIRATADKLADSLERIDKCLQQIKYTAFGAITVLIMDQSGMTSLVGALFP